MRIAIIYDAVYPFVLGGAERRNYELAERLRSEHSIAIYGFHYWRENSADCLPNCRYVPLGQPVELYHANGRRRIWEALVFAGRLFAALLHSQEELWDVSNFPYFSVPMAWLASRIKRRRLIVTWHEFWGEYWREYLGRRGIFGAAVERLALRCSPQIITVSEHTRRRLMAAGCRGERITVIPNGIDLAGIRRVESGQEKSDLIFVGRLAPHKRVDLLIEALALRHQHKPETTLCIVGDGPERGRLEELAQQRQVARHVRFVGQVAAAAEVYARLKAGQVFVSASEREGFGIAAIEAWACGIPVVICDSPGNAMPELVQQECQGRVVAAAAPAIADACRQLLDQEPGPRAAQLAEIVADYDWKQVAQRVGRVYHDALERNGS